MLVGTACGAAEASDEGDWGDTRWTDEDADGSLVQGLSAHESCDTVNASKTTWGWPADFLTSRNYGTSGCAKAYRLDADAYWGYDFDNDPRQVHWVGYGDSIPSDCGRIRFGIYIWENGSYIGSKWTWGKSMTIGGITYACAAAVAPVPEFDLTEAAIYTGRIAIGEDFRFAMSARLYNTAKDSSSGYVTRKIRSWTAERGDNDTL